VGEIGIWLLWLTAADEIGQPIAAMFLLIAMHLEHHVEIVAARAVPIGTDFFSVRGTFASAIETAGAVACLALILTVNPFWPPSHLSLASWWSTLYWWIS
jgi:microsomal dipeptidase-like Zn-dependent dipeptidase